MPLIELIGYFGSVLVVISLMMTNIWYLRWVSLSGSFVFLIYSWLIGAIPILVVNILIASVNIVHLIKIAGARDEFHAVEVSKDDKLLNLFIEKHSKDIEKFFPSFDWAVDKHMTSMLVLRNLIPVGLFIIVLKEEGVVDIHVDYVTSSHRDLKNGHFLYEEECSKLRERGYRTLRTRTAVPFHMKYIEKMGFKRTSPALQEFERYL